MIMTISFMYCLNVMLSINIKFVTYYHIYFLTLAGNTVIDEY